MTRVRLKVLGMTAFLCVTPSLALAATPLIESDSFALELGGYTSSTTGVQHRPYDVPTLPRTTGLAASLVRFEWRAYISDNITIDVHNRFFARVSSAPTDASVGLGSTVAPERSVDLQSIIVEESGLLVEHDLDRASASINTRAGDITMGRQAVTWGVSLLFPVADFWTQFSPFELDTSQKRGVDGVRFLTYPGDRIEVDLIAVDRGSVDDLSAGARIGWSSDMADYHFMLARNYERIWMAMGSAVDLDWARLYGEIATPFLPDESQLELPRATLGLNVLRSKYTVSVEYHFNGLGDDELLAGIAKAEVARGEQYLLGRHYLGVAGSYTPREFITFSLLALGALDHPSMLIAPSIDYEIAPDIHARFLSYVGVGDRPDLSGIPVVPSEFGAYGESYFFELSAFF